MVPVPPAMTPPPSSVTVILPVRNEERNVEACVRSLLRQSYGEYVVVVVEDGSEDATPAILARLAAESPRLRVIPSAPLPPGWVGKSWALDAGAAAATSEWLLFTDADTEHDPGSLAATVAFAEAHRLDMLSLITRQLLHSFWERAVMPAIVTLILQAGGSLEEVNDPRSPVAKANGQFILIRRAVWGAVGGHREIRGTIPSDFALAGLIKGRGYRLMLADGRRWVRTRMYRSLREIWNGWSKNIIAGQRVAPLLAGAVALLAVSLGPLLLTGLALPSLVAGTGRFWAWPALVLGATGILWQVARGMAVAREMRIPLVYGLLHPLGFTVCAGILLNMAFRLLSGRGVEWKGRSYGGTATPG